MKKTNLKTLVECAVMVALAFVLSLVKVWEMPFGGSVTLLSMLPIFVASLRHGPKWGLGTAFVYAITQALASNALSWGLTPVVLVVCYLLDYLVAFTVLGLAGFAAKKPMPVKLGVVAGCCLLRFLSHFGSGCTIWGAYAAEYGFSSPYLYSLCYNGLYMLPETIFTVIGCFIVLKAMEKRKML